MFYLKGSVQVKKYKLIGRTADTHESVQLGVINADNLRDCELFIAINFPQYYFGANIIEVPDSPDVRRGVQMCICVKEYYTNTDGTCPTPLEIALRSFNSDLKIKNGFCTREYGSDGISYTPLETLAIPLESNKTDA